MSMISLTCRNCGNPNLNREYGGWYVCPYCGSRFLLEPEKAAEAEEYREKMMAAFTGEDEDFAPAGSSDPWIDGYPARMEELEEYSDRLLSVEPEDPYAWAAKVYLAIEGGTAHPRNAAMCLEAGEKALEYSEKHSDDEDKADIAQFLRGNLGACRENIRRSLGSQEKRIRFDELLKKTGWNE